MLSAKVNINIRFAINSTSGKAFLQFRRSRKEPAGKGRRGRTNKKKALKKGELFTDLRAFTGWMMGFEPTTLRTTI